jgi:hypothetical protein
VAKDEPDAVVVQITAPADEAETTGPTAEQAEPEVIGRVKGEEEEAE